MALIFDITILDLYSNPGIERQQSMFAILGQDLSSQATKIHPTTSPKPSPSNFALSFPKDTPNINIRELMEVWAGWRDSVTGIWSAVDPTGEIALPFGGYIIQLKERLDGNEKQFQCQLVDYGFLLQKTPLLGWPTFVNSANALDYVGYPPGYSVQAWLCGHVAEGNPYDGVVPFHLGNGMQFQNVDPIFESIILNADTLPGTLTVVPGLWSLKGYYGMVTLAYAVADIANCALFAYAKNYYGGPELIVGYWIGAAIDGLRLVPDFHFANMADVLRTPDARLVSGDLPADAGEIPIADYWHERDAHEVQTRTIIQGIGGDVTQPSLPLVYADVSNPDHLAQYPTAYQLTPGWGGDIIFDNRLHTVELATFLGTYINDRVWGAQGAYTGVLDHAVVAGQWAQLRNPNEALNRVFPITSVEWDPGTRTYDIRLAFTQLTPSDILHGGLSDVLLAQQDLAYQNETGAFSVIHPGAPKNVAPSLTPSVPNQNWTTAGFSDTPAGVFQSTYNDRVDDTGGVTPPRTGPLRAKGPVDPTTGAQPDDGFWTSHATARPHPQLYALASIADGTVPGFPILDPLAFERIVVVGTGNVAITYKETGSGSITYGPFAGTAQPGSSYPITPPITANRGDLIDFVFSGTAGAGDPCYVALAEGTL